MAREPETQNDSSAAPSWQPLAKLFGVHSLLFRNILFLRGYEYSSNVYVLVGDGLAIVEPGNDYTAFLELWRLGYHPAMLKQVVLSHGHVDNSLGAFEILRSYAPLLAGSGGLELILHEAGPREYKEAAKGFGCRLREVRGGEILSLAGTPWEVLHTPGHTIDGISLFHAPTKTLFTGDIVLPDAMAEPDFRAGGRLDHYLVALKSLLRRDPENILPGHGLPVFSAGRRIIEDSYESLMMKIIGAESRIPWMEGARALAGRGLIEEALYCCRKELGLHPDNSAAVELEISCLNDLTRFEEALAALDHHGGSRDGSFPLLRGYALMGLGRHDESLASFDEALRLRPDEKSARVYKGMALYLAGRYDDAMEIEDFRNEFVRRFGEEVLKKKGTSPA
jgi:glyoxylase-like metal-dependent hydrolase (beta-lactamase superfamily II)